MAEIVSNECTFRLKRTPAGIEVTVQVSKALEALFKTQCGGRTTAAYFGPAESVSKAQYACEVPTGDRAITRALFLRGSSDAPVTVLVELPRSRDQLRDTAEAVRNYVTGLYEQFLRPCDITVQVTAKTMAPAVEATTTGPGARAPAAV